MGVAEKLWNMRVREYSSLQEIITSMISEKHKKTDELIERRKLNHESDRLAAIT